MSILKNLVCSLALSTILSGIAELSGMAEAAAVNSSVSSNTSLEATLQEARSSRQSLRDLLAIGNTSIHAESKKKPEQPESSKSFVSASSTRGWKKQLLPELETEPIGKVFKQQQERALYVKEIEAMNFDYLTYPTTSRIQPTHVFDDGKSTYLGFKPKLYQKDFRITVQHPDDRLGTTSFVILDGFLKLEGVFKALRITTGTSTCEIINKAHFTGI